MNKDIYKNASSAILKTELTKRSMTYDDLVCILLKQGNKSSEHSIRCKLYRGSFSTAFFLKCLRAINVTNLALSEEFFNSSINDSAEIFQKDVQAK